MHALERFVRRHYALLVPLVVFLFIVLPFVRFFPIWDAKEYFDGLYDATHKPFSIANFGFYGHPAYLFGLLYSVTQYLAPDGVSIVLLNLLSFAIGCLSIAAFHSIVRTLFPEEKSWNVLLMTLLFAVHPVVVANVVYFSPDAGILAFFLVTLALLLRGRHNLAALTGLLMVFTKEIGVALYALMIATYLLCYYTRRPELPVRMRIRFLLRRRWLFFPVVAFLLYFIYNRYVRDSSGLWIDFSSTSGFLGQTFLDWDFGSPRLLIAIKEMFVLNFLWIPTTVILVALIVRLWHAVFPGHPTHHMQPVQGRGIAVVISLLVLSVLLLTRQIPFMNVRYFLVIYPLTLLVFYYSLVYVTSKIEDNTVLLSALVVAQLVALQHSVDPVSLALFPTFPVGTGQMYALGKYDDCCGDGRDQLIYSLEYTALAETQDLAYAWIRPTPETVIVGHIHIWQGFAQYLSPVTFRRVATADEGFMPRYRTAEQVLELRPLPKEIYFLHYPNFPMHEEFSLLLGRYDILEEHAVASSGKTLLVSKLVLREG